MKYRKKPVVIEATQWFKNGDHPQDACEMVRPDPEGTTQFEPFMSEGKVVRYFRRPDVSGGRACEKCGKTLDAHGWIDTLEGGHIVCPGDWIITGVQGEHYPCKPDIFAATYELADQPAPERGWCFSVNEENYHGGFGTEEEAHAEAQEYIADQLEPGDEGVYWIARSKPAEAFLNPSWVGGAIEDELECNLSDDIGWDDSLVMLTAEDREELGRMVIAFVRAKNGFQAYGVGDVKEHKFTVPHAS